jgi:hypothetical protein
MAKSWDQYRLGDPYEAPRRKGLKTVVILAALMAITILPALAAKGGSGKGHGGNTGGTTGGSGTIAMRLVDPTDTVANFKDQVTFDISTTATQYPYVHLMCYQNGGLVAEGRQGFFPTALGDEWFYLGPTGNWQGGAADCTAYLEMYVSSGKTNWQQLASTSFPVAA